MLYEVDLQCVRMAERTDQRFPPGSESGLVEVPKSMRGVVLAVLRLGVCTVL